MQNEMANKHKIMNQSIVIREYGASNVLKIEENIINKPKKNELLIRHTGIGINYHDIYVRAGLYKTLKLLPWKFLFFCFLKFLNHFFQKKF